MFSEWQVVRYVANLAIHLNNAQKLGTNIPCHLEQYKVVLDELEKLASSLEKISVTST